MKLHVMRMALAVACLGLLGSAATADFVTSFDSSEGYATGNLPGQQGWVDTGAVIPTGDIVVSSPTHTGDQALIIGGRTKHTVNGPMSGADVDMEAWFCYNTTKTDTYWWDLMDSGGAINGFVTITYATSGPEGKGNYVMGQGGSVSMTKFKMLAASTWYDIKMRFLWDGASSYNKYDLWIDGVKMTTEGGFNLENALDDISDVLTIYAANDATYSAYSDDLSVTLVPEPATLCLLLAAGLFGLVARGLSRKRS